MDIVVTDTNIFIDLIFLDLLELFFDLPIRVHTTDFVINEFKNKEQLQKVQKYIHRHSLIIKKFSSNELSEIIAYQQNYPSKLSVTDCSVLIYAEKNGFGILTNDNLLRKKSSSFAIDVHGTIFVIKALHENRLIDRASAVEKLTQWMVMNPRAPKTECQKLIQNWSVSA